MVTARPVPDKGDLVWINLDPQAGHEQAGHRPGLVLSPAAYNKASGLAIVWPITNQSKGYPFEVRLPSNLQIRGTILADHVKSLDWRARGMRVVEKAPQQVVAEVLAKLSTLLE